MPAHRLPEGERKEHTGLKLRKKVIDAIRKRGSLQEIVEKLVEDYVKKNNLLDK